jgi:AraC-like DNA-binding protein
MTLLAASVALARPDAPRTADSVAALYLGEKRFSTAKIAALLEVLGELGVKPEAALERTGLDPAAVASPLTLTSSLQFLIVARNGLKLSDAPDIGLRVGLRLHASSYGMYGYALLCSETFRQACDTAIRYHQLANGMLNIRWEEAGGVASWLFPSRAAVTLPDLDLRLYRFLIDLQFAVHHTIIKDVMGPWCVPVRAHFTESELPHAAALAELLECPVDFGQPQNMLSYPAAWLSRAPQLANPITAGQVSTHCARLIEELRWQAGVTRLVYQELTRTPGKFPEIEQLAETLCMTSRTLRRKLEQENTSYSELLTSVRKALAIDYLGTTELSTDDIAATLGFSDAVSFRHAFKRWTGSTPTDYRRVRVGGGHSTRPQRAAMRPLE